MDKYECNMRALAKAMQAVEKNTAEIAKELKKMNSKPQFNTHPNTDENGEDIKFTITKPDDDGREIIK